MRPKPAGCSHTTVEISKKNLPLCCPQPDERVWDGHPRVYLPIEKKGQFTCPYCGTHYVLVD